MTHRVVVIAPDSFKGTIDAASASWAIADGYAEIRPDDEVLLIPQADGGEGTAAAIGASVAGARWHDVGDVPGPDGRPVPGAYVRLPDGTAIVELALTCGLPFMRHPDPTGAHTVGLGAVIEAALGEGVGSVVIALGGSASTDGAAGALTALGLRLLDASGAHLPPGGGALARLHSVDRARLRPPPAGGVLLLTDVDAPLLGSRGAAAVFGPQKGADAAQVRLLDAALERYAAVLGGDADQPGAGAAGGAGYGFATAWGARIVPGAAYVAEVTGLTAALERADLVITGEGRLDATSFGGKTVGNVLALARTAGVPAVVVAGQASGPASDADGRAVELSTLERIAGSRQRALADPASALNEAGRRIASGIAP